jgi:hypothetical protein
MSNIVVVGTASNVANIIENEINIIINSFSNHNLIQILIVESDSTDSTISKLESLSLKYKQFSFISFGLLSLKFKLRTERIAYCRNKYIEYLEENNFFNADYIYISDFDGINSLLSSSTIDNVLSNLNPGSGIAATANQLYKYYDIWALRHPIWSPSDCWYNFNLLKKQLGLLNAHYICNESLMININSSLEPIEVNSAFGGGAIYDIQFLNDCIYVGINNNNPICEHISFSKKYCENGGKIFIFPSFINHDKSNHVINAENYYHNLTSESIVNFHNLT